MGDTESPAQAASLLSAVLFETPEEICLRVFRRIRPRTPPPEIRVEFRQFANADSKILLKDGLLALRISDLFAGAPAPVIEALAHILIGKLYRKPVAAMYTHRYRMYLNRRDVRRQAHLVRQSRGRKRVTGPKGAVQDLEAIFDRLNAEHFDGLLGRPDLGWSPTPSRRMLGHFDPSHNAIVISRIFDRSEVPLLALDYVMFHEMLHLRFPVEHSGSRRRIHTAEFREAEKRYPLRKEAKEVLRKL
jgi:hypothetical protein